MGKLNNKQSVLFCCRRCFFKYTIFTYYKIIFIRNIFIKDNCDLTLRLNAHIQLFCTENHRNLYLRNLLIDLQVYQISMGLICRHKELERKENRISQ